MLKRIIFLCPILLSSNTMAAEKTKLMTVAGGCFWCMQPIFASEAGVKKVTAGYAGGDKVNPTYRDMGDHLETAQVEYDPAKITYEELLKIYWYNIDAFDADGQFYDRGHHYHTAIFYHDDEQKKVAERTKAEIEKTKGKKVATEILPYKNFYKAEDYHQDYYKKNPEAFKAYHDASGRDEKLKEIWK